MLVRFAWQFANVSMQAAELATTQRSIAAGALTGWAMCAGDEAAAVALGLLTPHREAQAAAEAALLGMGPPAAAHAASAQRLVAVLLSKQLWPRAAAASPAYPALARALLAEPALLTGGPRVSGRAHLCMEGGLRSMPGSAVMQGMRSPLL